MDETSNPFKLAAMSRADVLLDQQLLRDLAIVNARTTQELGSLPVGGLPVVAKRKPNFPRPVPTLVSTSNEHEETDMNLQQITATALLAAGVVACEPSGRTAAATEQASETLSQASSTHPKYSSADNLKAFIPEGASILAAQTGDLNRDGRMDAVIVMDPARTGKEFAGEGPSRIVMLLTRDENGQLRKAKQNAKLIPCEKCGGMAGDPFGYMQVRNGTFIAVIEGGSPSVHWSESYEFDYNSGLGDWVLRQVEHGVSDRIDDQNKQQKWTTADLGEVRFEDFDRSKLPHPITLLESNHKEP